MILRCAAYQDSKSSSKFIYERLIPYLSGMSLQSAINGEHNNLGDISEYSIIPAAGDSTYISALFECIRVVGRKSSLPHLSTKFVSVLLKYSMCKAALSDLFVKSSMNASDKIVLQLALKSLSAEAGKLAAGSGQGNVKTMKEILDFMSLMEKKMVIVDEDRATMPVFETGVIEDFPGCTELDLFGRFRREFSVEKLAGESPPPPILRPIEMTLVPDRVTDFLSMTKAMRHCLNLCVLLSNQRELIRNSYTLRICLIQHLFVRVIPLPLPITHPERPSKCFWDAQLMRYETQADIMHLLNLLCRHFATASLSVKMTRSGDAVRMLVFACMATICDATMRKTACDIPSHSTLHYSGSAKGPVKPFGFDIGTFAEESEYLKFVSAETTAARTQVLDYFHQMKKVVPKENFIFRFNESSDVSISDKRYIDQLCLQMGYTRNMEKHYITGVQRALLDLYPEVGFFRDLIFMFKLVMVPTSDQLPELKQWTPEEAALTWGFDEDRYIVKGFGKTLDCIQAPVPVEQEQVKQVAANRGFFNRVLKYIGLKKLPRSTPSQANPSILLGERVDTEDDILHIRMLPDFDGTLGAKDCELMLQYLTAPYMRIPLLLNFFTNEIRLKALRNVQIQEVLDAALFEPGQWQDDVQKLNITQVPADTRSHLCSPVGLLYNELIVSPALVLNSVVIMLERVIDMDTGKYSILSESILYVVRLVVKIEGYILFLAKNREARKASSKYYGSDWESNVRGLECDDEAMQVAFDHQKKLRSLLQDQVFKIIARWIKKAKDDGKMTIACMLHAHLAFIFRNMQYEEMSTLSVFAMLSCQVFLFNNYKYDLDLDESVEHKGKKTRKDNEEIRNTLGISQVELFDMFQLQRNRLLKWLIANPNECNEVLNSLVQMVEESERKQNPVDHLDAPINRTWTMIEVPGMNFRGRFVPQDEYDPEIFSSKLSSEARVSFEAWLRETTTLAVNTEINVQLGEFTIKKHLTQPLDSDIQENPDFVSVFQYVTHDDILQCAEVKHSKHRKWLRLIGMGYDVQVWDADVRKPLHTNRRLYGQSEPQWLRDIVDPWIGKMFPGIELYCGENESSKSEIATLYGLWPKDSPQQTMKEMVIYRYPKVLHVFNLIEYGRRWYRSLLFSSDPSLSFHALKFHAFSVKGEMRTCCGDPTVAFEPSRSVVMIKYIHEGSDLSQTFVPKRMLFGTLPDALLDSYNFWQNSDDSLTGYMQSKSEVYLSKSVLQIRLRKVGSGDSNGFCFSNAFGCVARIPINEDVPVGEVLDICEGTTYLLNPLALLFNFSSNEDSNSAINRSFSNNCAMVFGNTFHSLLRLFLRLENLSHILLWSKNSDDGTGKVAVDVIELPRLRLTFERRVTPDGKNRYYCVEQSGYYIAEVDPLREMGELINTLPNAVVLKNDDSEYTVLMSAIAKPSQFRLTKASPAFRLVFSLTDPDWISKTGEMTYFMYPIHLSNTLLQSKSIASTLYLLTLYMMTRNYREAFRLIDNCVCDRTLSAQEAQIFDVLNTVRDKLLVDSAACRLKLFFVSFGCRDIMEFKCEKEQDLIDYSKKFELVSSYCRLTPDIEMFILSKIPEEIKSQHSTLVNRERIMKVSFDLTFQKSGVSKLSSKNFGPQYPTYTVAEPFNAEAIDIDLLDVDKPTFKNVLQKLSFAKYNKLEPVTGPDCITFIIKAFQEQKNLGFFVLYELMNGAVPMYVIPDVDRPLTLASLFFRVMPDSFITGVQRVILHVMETNPQFATKLPIFEDKRRLKLPTFAGLDIFQSHVKAVATHIKTNKTEIDYTKLVMAVPPMYKPISIVNASPAMAAVADFAEGRIWFSPRVVDYTCDNRVVSSAMIPDTLTRFCHHYSSKEVTTLSTTPLLTDSVVNTIGYSEFKSDVVAKKGKPSGITVMNHPSSRSHIARTSVERLEKDVDDFYEDCGSTTTPFMKSIPREASEIESADLTTMLKEMESVYQSILTIKENDLSFVKQASIELLQYCNGSHMIHSQNIGAISHILLQKAHIETTLVGHNF